MTKRFLEDNGLELIVRSHEVSCRPQTGRWWRTACILPLLQDPFAARLNLWRRPFQVKDEGYEVEHEGWLVTLFSAPNYCDQASLH